MKTKKQIELEAEIKNTKLKLDLLQEENKKLNMINANLQTQNDLNNLDLAVAKAPEFNFNINNQFLQNGNYQSNLDILFQTKTFGNDEQNDLDYLTYLLVLRRATYFKSRIKLINCRDYKDKFIITNALYYSSLKGWVAVIENKKLVEIIKIEKDELTYRTINMNYSSDFQSEEKKTKDFIILKFNESHFSLWLLAYFYLQKITQYLKILDNQTKYLIKQMLVKLKREDLNNSQKFIKDNLFTLNTPFLHIDKDADIVALDSPSENLMTIFDFIENYKNWFDFNILGMNVKDIQSNKERDVASQQSNFANFGLINSQYYNFFLEEFLYLYNQKFNTNIWYEDLTEQQLQQQAEQSLTLNKQNDNTYSNERENNNESD